MPASPAHPSTSRPDSSGGAIPLWRQLDAVVDAVMAVRGGQSGTAALAAVDPVLRAGVQALFFAVLRQLGRAEALRAQLAPRRPKPRVDALLCSTLALGWQAGAAPYEPFTLVNQAVEAAKRHAATRGQAAFVNACLRRFLRERDALVAATESDPVARWNHPAWWIERLRKDHPGHWEQILRANNAQAPMALRIHRGKVDMAGYLAALEAAGMKAWPVTDTGLVLESPQPVQRLPGFADGWVSVQDLAAQQAAPLLLSGLDLGRPLRVLDACAAPGGKTAHLLEYAGAGSPVHVTALEIDPLRSARIGETLQRLGLQAQVLVADAGRPEDWWQQACGGEPFDAILLDAPCTASGIVRRHPDVRWLRRPGDIAQLAAQQARLLSTLWPLLRPGGRMLYCTCSVFRAEGDDTVQSFLANNNDAHLLPSPGHLLPRDPGDGGSVRENPSREHDGFFYALLGRLAA